MGSIISKYIYKGYTLEVCWSHGVYLQTNPKAQRYGIGSHAD